MEQKKHCCALMEQFLDERKVSINYSPRFRAYSIKLASSSGLQMIYYCPWCGMKLPSDLYDEFFAILESEYNIDDTDNPRIPQEFKSDEWWKKRRL
ncbi:MAG: hypothetical protein IT346_04725 [Epsilonproteobacteria bacterium]|nr:hypothetical protein [Campylobacterota bacterium]